MASGSAVVAGLVEAGHRPTLIEIDREGIWHRAGQEVAVVPGRGLEGFDVVFPVVHGPFGEDGTLQGLLESLRVPYVGSGVFASAACMDKIRAKQLLAGAGVEQVAWVELTESTWAGSRAAIVDRVALLGSPVWVKPARLGSSVGISRVAGPAELGEAVELALGHDPRVIIEASSSGREIEVSVLERPIGADGLGTVSSVPGEITLPGAEPGDWYDYERKYKSGGMTLTAPADLPPELIERVRSTAIDAFETLGCSGYARVDCFVEGDRVLINEVNTAPGFTSTSVFSALFAASGLSYPDLLDAMVEAAIESDRLAGRHSH